MVSWLVGQKVSEEVVGGWWSVGQWWEDLMKPHQVILEHEKHITYT